MLFLYAQSDKLKCSFRKIEAAHEAVLRLIRESFENCAVEAIAFFKQS